mgnify:CR=1 FL=1
MGFPLHKKLPQKITFPGSFSSILFQMLAGYLIDFTGYQMFYFVLFICSVIGMILVFFFKVPTNKDLKVFH